MATHELTVYPYHLSFLKDFPELNGWLNCNGFTVLHSHQDFRMQVLYTFWDDRTADAEKRGVSDAKNSIVVAYCQLCKTVEVYHRAVIARAGDEKTLVAGLDRKVAVAQSAEVDTAGTQEEPSVEMPLAAEIEKWIEDCGQQ